MLVPSTNLVSIIARLRSSHTHTYTSNIYKQMHAHTHETTRKTHALHTLMYIRSSTHKCSKFARGLPSLIGTLSYPAEAVRVHLYRMQDAVIDDRRRHLKPYVKCLKGDRFVSWLVDHGYATSRFDASTLGARMLSLGVIHDVDDKVGFLDSHTAWYRFRRDDGTYQGAFWRAVPRYWSTTVLVSQFSQPRVLSPVHPAQQHAWSAAHPRFQQVFKLALHAYSQLAGSKDRNLLVKVGGRTASSACRPMRALGVPLRRSSQLLAPLAKLQLC